MRKRLAQASVKHLIMVLLVRKAATFSSRTARVVAWHRRTLTWNTRVLSQQQRAAVPRKSLAASDNDFYGSIPEFTDPEYYQDGASDSNVFDPELFELEEKLQRQFEEEFFSDKASVDIPNVEDMAALQYFKAKPPKKAVSNKRQISIPNFSIFEDISIDDPPRIDNPPRKDTPITRNPRVATTQSTKTLKPPPPLPDTHYFPAQGSGDPEQDAILAKAASGNGGLNLLDTMEMDLQRLIKEIYAENNGVEFNINSSKQVAVVLFGPQGGSTEKDVLEAKAAAGHRMSDLVLQYRALRREITKLKTKKELTDKGLRVRSASKVVRESTNGEHSRPYEQSADPLILVDASAYIFRAYYSMPPIHRSDGMPTGAVLGFCNMLNRLALNDLLSGNSPRLVLVFDSPGKSFRSTIYPAYKGNRPDAPVDLIPQFAFVRQAANAYGITRIEADTYEADDVIATLACQAQQQGIDVNIFSGDKDLMQLVTDKHVQPSIHMIDPATMARVTHDEVVEKWGLPPSQLGDLLALAGDTADNVPGVPGIGPKIAAQLIQEYGSLENLYENVDNVKQKARRAKLTEFKYQAFMSRQLVELDRNVPGNLMKSQRDFVGVGDLRMEPMDPDRIVAFYDAMGFNDIKRRFLNSLNRGGPQKKRPINNNKWRRPKATVPRPDEFDDVPF